jgi:iron complex outermembrane receptor protein
MRSSPTKSLLRRGMSALPLMIAIAASPAAAQMASATGAESDTALADSASSDIVVTARRREENLLDTPLSITAVNAEQLQKSGTNGLEDLAKTTPGLAFQSLGGTYQAPVIRGLAQVDQTAQIGNVGVFVDGIYLNNRSGMEFGFLDLERIEVVKGPQSALYGRNTFSGAINYVSKAPKLGRWDGYITGEVGNYDRLMVQGSLNIPLADFAALRVFGGIGKFNGTIRNVRDDQLLGGYDQKSNYGASLLIKPTDNLSIKLFGMRTDVSEDQAPLIFQNTALNNCGPFSPGGANGPRFTLFCGRLPKVDNVSLNTTSATGLFGHSYLAYATAGYDFGFAELSGTYGYTKSEFGQFNDQTGDPTAITRPLATGSPLSQQAFLTATGVDSHESSYDLKLSSSGSHRFDWTVGLYYYDSYMNDISQNQNAQLANNAILVPVSGTGRISMIEGYAIYGQFSYNVTDKFRVGVDGRYSWESLDFSGTSLTAGVYTTGIIGKRKYDYFTPRFTVDYDFSDAVHAYASAARGYKIGGFNANASTRPEFEYFPETNWTYEIGIKGKLFGGKVVYAADLFYVEWSNIQTQMAIPSTTISVVGNNLGASSKGVELDATYYFTPKIWIRGAAAFMDPTYKSGTLDGEVASYCGLIPGTTITTNKCSNDVGGKQIARTTKNQYTVTGSYATPVTDMFDFFVRGDYSYQEGKSSLSLNLDDQGPISLINARIGFESDKIEVSLWARNLLDTNYIARATVTVSPNDGLATSGVSRSRIYPGERRTIGLRATYRL